jgi:hypothetical protein
MVEKLDLPFPLLSDPKGELIKRLGLWNEEEGVSEPAIIVLDGSGTARHLYSGGKDFSDRPYQESLFEMLDGMDAHREPNRGEPEVQVSAEEAEEETVRPDRPAITLEQLGPYYRGTYFATVAIKKKFAENLGSEGEAPSKKVEAYQKLVNEYNAAIQETAKK